MDCKTIADLVLTAGIVVFACLTWLATKRYAYVTGLALFVETNREIVGNKQNFDTETGIKTMRAIKKRFPEVYEDMKECLNKETQAKVEK